MSRFNKPLQLTALRAAAEWQVAMRSDRALSNSRNIIDDGEYNTPSMSPESCSGRMCGCYRFAVVRIAAKNRLAPSDAAR